jgi:GNAT superfamily N-acetyltransferase
VGVPVSIRAPRPAELVLLPEISRAAGSLFTAVGLAHVAAHEPESVEALAQYLVAGRVWIVVEDDVPVGYALVDIVDDLAHLEQLSVRPDHGRHGLGTALLAHVCEWARQHHFEAVTLTTFEHLRWNAPFYAAHGFTVLDDGRLGPELRRLRDEEAQQGLDPALRVCMRRRL